MLLPFLVDTPLCDVEVFLVHLEADEVPTLPHGRDSRSAAANAVVKDGVVRIGVSTDEIADKLNGLLGGMERIFAVMHIRKLQHRLRITMVATPYGNKTRLLARLSERALCTVVMVPLYLLLYGCAVIPELGLNVGNCR